MVKFLVMDVDGTLTDGKIYMGADGELMKAFDIKDGLGIHELLIPGGIVPVIITGRSSRITEKRCKEIGIKKIYQGVSDKLGKLNEILGAEYGLETVAYIGDDLNDLPVMNDVKKAGGVIGCPADAVKAVRDLADYVCEAKGGRGAVREFIEFLIREFSNGR